MFNLLASGFGSYLMIFAFVGILVLFGTINSRSARKRQQEQQKVLDSVRPGNKVKTIGGVCGVVVEVNDEDNTFVLETGTETSGKSYIKFDKQAIYQTDALMQKEEPATEEETEEPAPAQEPFEETAQEPVEEPVAEEETENND